MTTPDKKKTHQKVTLKTIADHLGLTSGTVSAALDNSAAARSIRGRTKQLYSFPASLSTKACADRPGEEISD